MKFPVIQGISFPYFPPRPTTGVPLTKATKANYIERESVRYYIQPKLNGDRALFCLLGGKVGLASRHGRLYTFSCDLRPFNNLPDCTVLDGEVWHKQFFPFEAVILGGSSLMRECPSVRGAVAKDICLHVRAKWLFETPSQAWIDKLDGNGKDWEGCVKKLRGSPYLPLASATSNSSTIFKNKWV